jgi:glycosyltransferase involved in cell wall biosynthesis
MRGSPLGVSRILFASSHGYIDPSSGAALATRDLMELLASRGIDCRVLSTGVLDFARETPLQSVLTPLNVPISRAAATLPGGRAEVLDFNLRGVRVTLLPTASSRIERSSDDEESRAFLGLAEQVFERFRPQILLTYGGRQTNCELMKRARRRGIPVVFHLHNLAYTGLDPFADASAVLVPSEFSRRTYAERLGLECTAIPLPLNHERIVADDPDPRYLTFINPQPAKGLAFFARIAYELARSRPDIPLLVVESRQEVDSLDSVALDLSALTNLHKMANTQDPRDFYRVSRAILMPSLWQETFGRVAAEGLANGLPVLASDRGALPETLGNAGFVFHVPERYTPDSKEVPTREEVTPWLTTIERLWDDRDWEIGQKAKAKRSAYRWDNERLAEEYTNYFIRISTAPTSSR